MLTSSPRIRPSAFARRWRQYQALVGFTLLAAAVLVYWAIGQRPPALSDVAGRHPQLQLIPDSSLPEPQHRRLDELTIELAPKGGARVQFALQRRRDGQHAGFYLTPPGSRADDAQVETLLSALLSTVAERQLDPAAVPSAGPAPTAAPLDEYGVGAGQCRVRVLFGAGHTLCFGAQSPSGAVYVQTDRAPAIRVVDGALFELLARPPLAYRNSRVILDSLASAQKVELGPLQLFHDGDLWRVQTAGESWTLAEPARAEELVQRLASWTVSAWPTDSPADPRAAPAGPLPSAPPLRLIVDGKEQLSGGWPCPPDPATRLFVRSDGQRVCAEDPADRRWLPGGPELRAQRLLPLPSAQVMRLQLPGLDVVRQPDGTYRQSGQPAETASVRRILALLSQGRTLTAAGPLEPPPTAVRLTVTAVLGQTITLQLWRSGAQTVVQRDREPAQLLGGPVDELFSLSPLSFAPLTLLAIEPTAVQRLSRQGPTVEVLERATGWHLREPTVAPADSAAVQTLLATLVDLRAERWVSLQPRPEYGLDPPRLRLSITEGKPEAAGKKESAGEPGAATPLSLEVGGRASDRGDCYVWRRPGPVAVVAAATCATLGQPLLSPLLLRVDDDRLTALQLSRPDQPALSCSQRNGGWQCGGRALPAAAQHALLAALHALQRGEQPDYAPTPTAPPRFTLQVTHTPLGSPTLPPSSGGAAAEVGEEVAPPEQTLRLYPAADATWLARLDQRGVTYHLPSSSIGALQDALASPRPAPP